MGHLPLTAGTGSAATVLMEISVPVSNIAVRMYFILLLLLSIDFCSGDLQNIHQDARAN